MARRPHAFSVFGFGSLHANQNCCTFCCHLLLSVSLSSVTWPVRSSSCFCFWFLIEEDRFPCQVSSLLTLNVRLSLCFSLQERGTSAFLASHQVSLKVGRSCVAGRPGFTRRSSLPSQLRRQTVAAAVESFPCPFSFSKERLQMNKQQKEKKWRGPQVRWFQLVKEGEGQTGKVSGH